MRDAAFSGPRYCGGQSLCCGHNQVTSSWPKIQRKLLYYPITNIFSIFTPSPIQTVDIQSEFMIWMNGRGFNHTNVPQLKKMSASFNLFPFPVQPVFLPVTENHHTVFLSFTHSNELRHFKKNNKHTHTHRIRHVLITKK